MKDTDKLFDIDKYNKISFEITKTLNAAFLKVSELLNHKITNEYYNIVGLLYHEFTKLICSYYFLKYEITTLRIEEDLYSNLFYVNQKLIKWPINYDSILTDTFKSEPKSKKIDLKVPIKNIIKLLKHLNWGLNSKSIMILPGLYINDKKITEAGFKIDRHCNYNLFPYKFSELQWNILEKELKTLNYRINNKIEIKLPSSDNFICFLKEVFFSYKKTTKQKQITSDFIISGSLSNIKNRLVCANAKLQGKKVIHIMHGELSGVIDEPFLTSEKTYCDFLIGYGKEGCEIIKKSKNEDLFKNENLIIGRKSKKISLLYKNSKVERIKLKKMDTLMYVPTSFSLFMRYGPYRDMNDIAYLFWQNNLLKALKDIFLPKKIIKKEHRKNVINARSVDRGIIVKREEDFYNLIEFPTCFVFDYPTTAFAYAAATSKPILYFDIGLRNLTDSAIKHIKNRCVYVKGSPKHATKLVKSSYKNANKNCKNTFTEKHSIGDLSCEDVILNILNGEVDVTTKNL